MAAQKSPLLGYNHNLKYKGRVYHVQTEDSGLDNPHTFTHLFHSGSILRTSKQEYRDLLGDPEWESKLRERMQVQHKEMIRELVKGLCDDRILAFFGTLEAEVEEEVPMATLQPPPRRERTTKGEAVAPAPPVQQVQQVQQIQQIQQVPLAPAPAVRAQSPSATPWNPPAPPGPAPAQRPMAPSQSGGVVVSMPMVIVGGQGAPAPRAASPSTAMPVAQGWQAPAVQGPQPPPARQASQAQQAQQAPAGTFRPEESKPMPDSIFGSDLISEKSLDEVILAYLSEDLAEK